MLWRRLLIDAAPDLDHPRLPYDAGDAPEAGDEDGIFWAAYVWHARVTENWEQGRCLEAPIVYRTPDNFNEIMYAAAFHRSSWERGGWGEWAAAHPSFPHFVV